MFVPFLCGFVGIPGADEFDLDVDGDINSDLVEVDGYERADGTFVEAHVRTAPDGDLTNNLSWWDLVNA